MNTRYRLLVIAAGMVASTVSPARAILLTQDTAPVSFTINGSQTPTSPNTQPLSFAAFNASAPSTLTGVQVKFVAKPQFGGTALLVNVASSGSASFSGSAGPAFTFSSVGVSSIATSTPFALKVNNLPAQVPPLTFLNADLSGDYAGTASAISASSSILQSYFSTAPAIASYYANWSIVGAPSATTASNVVNATLTGDIYLSYQYTAPDPVPSPLPILGAGAAFGFSRKLRKRIRSSAA